MYELSLIALVVISFVFVLGLLEDILYITYYGKKYRVETDGIKVYSRLFGRYGRYIRADNNYKIFKGQSAIIHTMSFDTHKYIA